MDSGLEQSMLYWKIILLSGKLYHLLVDTSYDDYGWRANGLLTQLEKCDTYFGLISCPILYLIHVFSGTEQTLINLQYKNTSVKEAISCVDIIRNYPNRLRSDDSFRELYAFVVKVTQQYTEEPFYLDVGSQPEG